MIVCPACHTASDEDGYTDVLVCRGCGGDLTPRWMTTGNRKTAGGGNVISVEPYRQPPRWHGFAFVGALVWALLFGLLVTNSGSSDGPESRLERLAQDIVVLVDSGKTDAIAGVLETARVESGCGWINPFLIPAPQQQQAGGIGGGAPVDPEQAVAQEVIKRYKPDIVVTALAGADEQVVAVAGWACG